MNRKILLSTATTFVLAFFTHAALAIVDMKSSGYSESTTHLSVPGIGYDLRVNITYSSRSLFNGIFGFGWCSDYETKIEVTPESNLKLTECGGGMEINFTPRNFNPDRINNTIKTILSEIKKRRPELKPDYLASLEKELQTNDFMREEFGRRLNLQGRVEEGSTFLANGREAESIVLKNGTYKRTLVDGTHQIFDAATGRLLSMYDKNQNYLKLQWDKSSLISVADNQGRKLTFKYNPTTKKISEIVGPDNLLARFLIKGEDLVQAENSKGEKYKYTYDDVHNLIRIDLPDGSYKALTYNKDKDWVTSFRNERGCVESYDYQVSKDDPEKHFWSNVVKKCGDKVTNRSKYEFFHKNRSGGPGIYLHRVKSEVNESVTDITYHEVFGKPVVIIRDGSKTEYAYLDNGMVKSKKEPGRITDFEYKNSCGKVSQVLIKYINEGQELADQSKARKPSQKSERVTKTTKTRFTYDTQKCNLLAADNSDGQTIRLQYDAQGRISQIQDQAKKLVHIRYENKFGKPSVVTRPGLGTIQVSYNTSGEILKVESAQGPTVAVQVASIFNNLLDIIAPATSESPL
jgi:YD repeat-containing protein